MYETLQCKGAINSQLSNCKLLMFSPPGLFSQWRIQDKQCTTTNIWNGIGFNLSHAEGQANLLLRRLRVGSSIAFLHTFQSILLLVDPLSLCSEVLKNVKYKDPARLIKTNPVPWKECIVFCIARADPSCVTKYVWCTDSFLPPVLPFTWSIPVNR